MAVDLTTLQNAVARNNSVDGSAAELIRGINQRIKDAIAADDLGDASNINALVAELDASSDRLAAAVSENTPASGDGGGGGEELPPLPEPGGSRR